MAVVAALATAVLLGGFAARHFASLRAGLIAIALFATMPVVWSGAGNAAPQLALLPFLMLWLFAADRFAATSRVLWIGVAGGSLAMMVYAHRAGLVMAPAYLMVCAAALLLRKDRVVSVTALAIGFAIVFAPWLVQWWRHPALVADAVKAYGLYDADRFNILQGAREITSWVGLTVRTEVFWDCFSPALLFFDGVFLFPLAIPLVLGLYAYLAHPRSEVDWMVVGAFAASPLFVALIAQPPVAARLLLLAPLAAIISTRGCYPGAFRTTVARSPAASGISASSV